MSQNLSPKIKKLKMLFEKIENTSDKKIWKSNHKVFKNWFLNKKKTTFESRFYRRFFGMLVGNFWIKCVLCTLF